jgi:hypothetical protein
MAWGYRILSLTGSLVPVSAACSAPPGFPAPVACHLPLYRAMLMPNYDDYNYYLYYHYKSITYIRK